MNRFEKTAEKLQKKYGVRVEYNPQSMAHPYVVDTIGATDARDAERLAREIRASIDAELGNA